MTTVAIIQARMGSTRLPAKALVDIAGKLMLARVIERTSRAKTIDRVVVATTIQRIDDAIVGVCERAGWGFFRGSEDDVLDRYCHAANLFQADVVVRITSDCPLIDPDLIDDTVNALLDSRVRADYSSNTLEPRTYPRGLDVEAMWMATLDKAWREDKQPESREHVTPFIRKQPDVFALVRVSHAEDESRHRWTVDTKEDLEVVRAIYAALPQDTFSWLDVLTLIRGHPELAEINAHIGQKPLPPAVQRS